MAFTDVNWSLEATGYTRPTYNADDISWQGVVEVYAAVGVGVVIVVGQSSISYTVEAPGFEVAGEGILGTGTLGASTDLVGGINEVYSAIGVGAVVVTGESIVITEAYSTEGVGVVTIAGQSFIEKEFSITGVGVVNVVGNSEIKLPVQAIGEGVVSVIGNSQIRIPLVINGIGIIRVIGSSIAVRGIADIKPNWLSTHYLCYVGTDLVEVKIKSAQIRYANGRLYIGVVVPAATQYLSTVLDRINENVKLVKRYNYQDGGYSDFVLAEAALETVRVDQGGNSGETMTLNALTTLTTGNPNQLTLLNPTYRSQVNSGARRYRCEMDPRVRPGNVVTVNGESFTVASVVHYIEPYNVLSEVAE